MKWLLIVCVLGVIWIQFVVSSDNGTASEHEPNLKTTDEYRTRCNCRCGERNEAGRITGGVETAPHEFPWVARLSLFNKFYCGATLLNDRYLVTAAHCVKGFMWFMIRASLGEHDRCARSQPLTRYILRVVAHQFTYATFRDDIALLHMNHWVAITDTVKPVCMPHNDENSYVGVKAIAAGWGSISEQRNHSCKLLEVEVPVLSNEECRSTKYEPHMIGDGMMCAGYPHTGGKDTCQGDSGGALAAERGDKRYEMIGVVSWGIGCGRVGYPGVYTRVSKYLYWLRHHARPACFCTD